VKGSGSLNASGGEPARDLVAVETSAGGEIGYKIDAATSTAVDL